MLQNRWRGIICAVLFLACLSVSAHSRAAEPGEATSGAGELSRTAVSSLDIVREIGLHQGKVVVVNFYAAWCPPCRREIPHLISLRESFSESDVAIIGISLDDTHEDYARFVKSMKINYPTWRAGRGVMEFFEISAIPVVLYYNRENALQKRVVGLQPLARMRANIEELLQVKE